MSAPERLFLATCDGQDLGTVTAGRAPAWVQLLPVGRIEGRDGRSWTLTDPAALIADFAARNVDLAIDYMHQSDAPVSEQSGPVPAAGWIKELRLSSNAIWGEAQAERAGAPSNGPTAPAP